MGIFSSIAEDLKFDWSIQVTWKQRADSLVQQHKSWQILQLLPFLITVGAGSLFLRNRLLLYYFESLFTANIFTVHRKTPVLEFLFNQPVACYFFNKRVRHRCFLVNFVKLSGTPFLQITLGLLLLYLLKISVTSQNLVLISQSGFPKYLRHS